MNDPTVRTFNEERILEDLKKSGKYEAVELIKSYKRLLENQQRITAKAIKKLKETKGNNEFFRFTEAMRKF